MGKEDKFGMILHVVGKQVHGPVDLYVADDGRMALVCVVDGMGWELPSASPAEPASENKTFRKRTHTWLGGSPTASSGEIKRPDYVLDAVQQILGRESHR